MSNRTSRKKHLFVLKLSSTFSELHNKYNISLAINTTAINEDVLVPETITFHDELHKLHKCCVSAIMAGKKYSCYWCRHPFDTPPIGCPINYKPKIVSRTYNSEISKDSFAVLESIPRKSVVSTSGNISSVSSPESYETDGAFCSFNCALAFAQENRLNPLYSHSITLINRIYADVAEKGSVLMPSPSWRLLEEYGGSLSIDEYRKNLHRISYEESGIQRPIFRPIAITYEERYKL